MIKFFVWVFIVGLAVFALANFADGTPVVGVLTAMQAAALWYISRD